MSEKKKSFLEEMEETMDFLEDLKRFDFEETDLPGAVYHVGEGFLEYLTAMTYENRNTAMYRLMKSEWERTGSEFPYTEGEFSGKIETRDGVFILCYGMPRSANPCLASRIYILFSAKIGETRPMYFTVERQDGCDLICTIDGKGTHKALSFIGGKSGTAPDSDYEDFVFDYYMENR